MLAWQKEGDQPPGVGAVRIQEVTNLLQRFNTVSCTRFVGRVDDQRYASDQIVSHDDGRIHAEAVSNAMEVQAKLDVRTEVIGIDEAQFLGEAMIDFVVRLADRPSARGARSCRAPPGRPSSSP